MSCCYCQSCSLTFNQYEDTVWPLAIYPDIGKNLVYTTLGLVGESGEFCEKIKKIIRGSTRCSCHPEIGVTDRALLKAELGDVLWYVMACAKELGMTLEDVARFNVEKLVGRQDRGTLHGSGDDR